MPSAMSGENIKLTCPLCHELWKMVLSIGTIGLVHSGKYSIAGHHGMPSVHIKLINTNSDA